METTEKNKQLPKLICTVGCSGTGKSTWASKYVDTNDDVVIVNRDNIRRLLFGVTDLKYYWDHLYSNKTENLVSDAEKALVLKFIKKGITVILDSTLYDVKYIRRVLQTFAPHVGIDNIEFKLFGEYYEDKFAKTYWGRVYDRPNNKISFEIVSKQFNSIKNFANDFDRTIDFLKDELGKGETLRNLNDKEEKEHAVIFDLDGTLADHSHRSPYDASTCVQDKLIPQTFDLLLMCMSAGYKIILCSGRNEKYKPETKKWLKINNIPYDMLLMRNEEDMRKDYIVKTEMWRRVLKDYNIAYMVDDRLQVVDHARNLGFFVFQIQNEDF